MRKFIIFVAAMLLMASVAHGTTAWDIRWGQDVTSNMASNTLKQWAEGMEGRVSYNPGTGVTYFVDSGVTVEGDGSSWTKARNTVDEAINLCTASRGDVIYVAPGHAESYSAADGFDADVAGITIIMLGNGALAPTFTFADTDATIAIGAANVRIIGGRYLAGISEVVTGISVEAGGDDCVLDGLFFPEPTTSTWEFDKAIVLAAGADRVTVRDCIQFTADATGATNFLDMDTGVNNGTRVINNWLYGEYAEGAIHSDQIDLDIHVWGNTVYNLTTGQHGIELTAAALGTCGYNCVYADGATTAIDPGSMKAVAPNWIVTAIDKSPIMFPAQDDGATNLIGVDDADNLASTSSVAANRDGSILERLEHLLDALVDDETSNLIGFDDADNSAATTNVVANANGSILERAEAIQRSLGPYANHPNYFTVDVNLANATWNTAAAHEIATVTGACRVQMLIEVTETCVTTGPTGTMALGFEGNASAIFSATGLDSGGTTFTAGDVVSAVYGSAATTPASGANTSTGITGALFDVVVVGGKDIGYTIATNAATDGTLVIHVWWEPLDATGAVVAGAGGVL